MRDLPGSALAQELIGGSRGRQWRVRRRPRRTAWSAGCEKCTGCGECLDYCPAPGALVQYAAAG